jgi:superfamily I DNA/RNA helicase
MWLVPEHDLTVDQMDAVRQSTIQHRVIIGGPGSGKTLVLLHRARRFVDQGLPESQIRVIVYTKVLRRYLQSAIESLGFQDETVTNIDKLIVEIHRRLIGNALPTGADGKVDWDKVRSNTLEKYKSENRAPMFDAVLVDEGQDLTSEALELLVLASEHLTIAMDSRQDVFNTGMGIQEVCSLLGVPRESAQLLTAYRCTRFIVTLAAAFLPKEKQADFRNSNLMSIDGIRRPEVCLYSDQEKEYDTLYQRLVSESLQGNSSAVVLPTTKLQFRYAKALKERGIEVAVLSGKKEVEHDYMGLTPMILTYHSAKGLTVDSVFLPGLSASAFEMEHMASSTARDRLLFVAITRAVKWLWLGIPKEGTLPETAKLFKVSSSPTSNSFVIFDSDSPLGESEAAKRPKGSWGPLPSSNVERPGSPPIMKRPSKKINVTDLL